MRIAARQAMATARSAPILPSASYSGDEYSTRAPPCTAASVLFYPSSVAVCAAGPMLLATPARYAAWRRARAEWPDDSAADDGLHAASAVSWYSTGVGTSAIARSSATMSVFITSSSSPSARATGAPSTTRWSKWTRTGSVWSAANTP